jgi:hypothetical protein
MIRKGKFVSIFFIVVFFCISTIQANPFFDLYKITDRFHNFNNIVISPIENLKDSLFIDNDIFYKPDGEYYYSLSQKYYEINDNFIKEIIGGNIFVIFNWVKVLMFQKIDNSLKIKFSKDELYDSKISKKLISLFDTWLGYVCSIIDNSIEINYDQYVSIDYEITKDNTLFIHNVKGVQIKNKISMSNKLLGLLDISRYKLLYRNNCVFLGIVNTEKEEYFEYYVYTSITDIEKRGLNEVFSQSNEDIRKDLKPYVKCFF